MRYNSDEWASWKKIRTAALRRARYRCEVIGCGIKGARNLTVHHILPRDEGGGDYEENLIALCGPHHDQTEILAIRERSLIRNIVEPISPLPPVLPTKRQIIEEITATEREVLRIIEPEINKPKGQRWWDKEMQRQEDETEEQPTHRSKPGKILRRLGRRLTALHHGARCGSWGAISKLCGHRGGVWAWRVAKGDLYLSEEEAQSTLDKLPTPLWATSGDLDALVLQTLRRGLLNRGPMRGYILAFFCEANDRTIRRSIKRLREKGHNISASLAPPRGYRLEEEA